MSAPSRGLFLLGVAGDCRDGAAKVDPDRVGVDDPAILLAAFLVFPTVRVLLADDDHGVSPMQRSCSVLAQLEAGLHEVRGRGVVCDELAAAVLPRVLDDSARYCIKCEYVSALFAIWSSGSLMALPVSLSRTLLLPSIRI